jgi:hypothetical protein
LLQSLHRDPSLRYSEPGRALLQWIFSHVRGPEGGEELAAEVHSHVLYTLAELARVCAAEWSAFADQLEQRIRESNVA